jgi:hypothetical protein
MNLMTNSIKSQQEKIFATKNTEDERRINNEVSTRTQMKREAVTAAAASPKRKSNPHT